MTLKESQDFLVCDYCGTMHFPDPNADGIRVLEQESPLACPICVQPLIHAAAGGERILYCGRCHGILVSMDVFLAVIQDLRSRHEANGTVFQPPDWRDLDRRIKCPQCGQTMDTHAYGGPGNVIIDDCETCSLNWLDYGELQRIVRAPDHNYEDMEDVKTPVKE